MKKILEILSFQIIISIAMTMIIDGIAILLGDKVRGIYWIFAMLIAIGYSFIKLKGKKRIIHILLTNILFLTITFITFYVNHYFYDTSWDGQWYHQEAVIKLEEGWNPLYDGHLDEKFDANIWVNHYTKGNWYYAASLYDLFDDLEIGKSYNVLPMISLFLLTYVFLFSKMKWYWSIVGAIAITLNPVAVNQILTNYNDGQIGIIMSIMVILLLQYKETKAIQYYRMIGLLLIVLANVKFTALAYGMILVSAPFIFKFYTFIFIEKKKSISKLIIQLVKMKELKIFIAALFVGIIVIGAASYVTNTVDHKHPFYPLAGEGKIDIMTHNTPKSIDEKPLYQQFYLSLFGEMTNDRIAEDVAIKFPLTISDKEEGHLGSVDIRIGGFGPYFGFIVILTVLIMAIWRKQIFRKENIVELIILLLIILSIIINPELWWARYIPQIWLIPLLISWTILKEKTKPKSIMVFIMVIVMMLNSGIMMKKNIENNIKVTAIRNEQLTMLKKYATIYDVIIQYSSSESFRSNRIMFKGLKNQKEELEVKEFCQNKLGIQSSSTTRVCIPNEKDYKEIIRKNNQIIGKYAKEEE